MKTNRSGTWMWGQALEMLENAERLQRQFFQPGAGRGGCWEPPVDVYQSGDDLWIFVAMPGVPQEGVEVLIDGTTLIVRGERPLPAFAHGAVIHRLEMPYGPFERRIGLPTGRYQLLQRTFDAGCLVLGVRPL
jgi:HSP20 family protein